MFLFFAGKIIDFFFFLCYKCDKMLLEKVIFLKWFLLSVFVAIKNGSYGNDMNIVQSYGDSHADVLL